MQTSARPQHWVTDGDSPQCFPVKSWSEEGMAIGSYFLEAMPEGTEINVIERWEHGPLFGDYCQYSEEVIFDLSPAPPKTPARANSKREGIEAWLFCGTADIDEVLTDGFPATDVNLHDGKFGHGIYFARDPRLPHHVLQRMGVHQEGTFQLILARVAVGRCMRQTALRRKRDVVRDEHCRPPPLHHSCTLARAPGCEVIVFPGHSGTPAYPAYVVTYRTQVELQSDPYEELAMLRATIVKSKVLNANPFKQYLDQCRPHWKNPSTKLRRVQDSSSPAGSPMAAIRARHLEDCPGDPDLDAETTTMLVASQGGTQGNQGVQPQRPPSRSASSPMLSIGSPPGALAQQEQARKEHIVDSRGSALLPLRTDDPGPKPKKAQQRSKSAATLSKGREVSSGCDSSSTDMSIPVRPETADRFSTALNSYSGAVAIEVSNLPDLTVTGVAPEAYISQMLNPRLRVLKDFDALQGEPIRLAWSQDPDSIVLEMQSKWLVASTARILDGLALFGSKLQVSIVPTIHE